MSATDRDERGAPEPASSRSDGGGTGEIVISVKDLTMGWDDTVLQKDASFDVYRGDVFSILGGSGCGKSTMLRYLIGLEQPMGGEISVAGIGKPSLEVGYPPFGVMFQSGALFGSLSVGENVLLPLTQWTNLPPGAAAAVMRSKLRLVGLSGAETKKPDRKSVV